MYANNADKSDTRIMNFVILPGRVHFNIPKTRARKNQIGSIFLTFKWRSLAQYFYLLNGSTVSLVT